MNRIKRTLSFRKKKSHVPESSKPHQWQEDEQKVRDGTCSFQVRYLGCIEVFESRGIQVCEEAVKALKVRNHRSVWSRMSLRKKKKDKTNQQSKGKYQRAILYVSGDALRVVDEISKGLIVDQTIEKVSFCAPDRNQEKGFSYICRDGTTRRWMCHGFLALKESGERLSHAVGCAFAICLEKKQRREKESVTVTFNDKGTSFTRTGSFRQTTLTERLADPQSAIIAEPVPQTEVENPFAVQRPRASEQMLERQGSFRGFSKLADNSPFKRQLSLRLNELPSTLDRQKQLFNSNGPGISAIPEASPIKEEAEMGMDEGDTVTAMCQEVSQGLTALTGGSTDPFSPAPRHTAAAVVHTPPTSSHDPASGASGVQPIRQNNPWAAPSHGGGGKVSDAEFWLASTATRVHASPNPFEKSPHSSVGAQHQMESFNGGVSSSFDTSHKAPHLAQVRSQSVDTAVATHHQQRAPTLQQLHHQGVPVQQFQSVQQPAFSPGIDAFEAAWVAKGRQQGQSNPFHSSSDSSAAVTQAFKVNL